MPTAPVMELQNHDDALARPTRRHVNLVDGAAKTITWTPGGVVVEVIAAALSIETFEPPLDESVDANNKLADAATQMLAVARPLGDVPGVLPRAGRGREVSRGVDASGGDQRLCSADWNRIERNRFVRTLGERQKMGGQLQRIPVCHGWARGVQE